MKVQTRGAGKLGVERMLLKWSEVKSKICHSVRLCSRHTQHGNTSGVLFSLFKPPPNISQFTYKCQMHHNFRCCFHSYTPTVSSRSRNQGVRRGCTKPPHFKRLPVFLKHANGAILQGLILAHLYAFVLSKCMCVFSPLLFLLCVADSSQDLTESSHCRAACQALPLIYPFSSHRTD